MKRVNVLFLAAYAVASYLCFFLSGCLWVPPLIRCGYFIVWMLGTLWYFLGYPKYLKKRILRLKEQMGSDSVVVDCDFFFAEGYLIDKSGGRLIGLFLLSPFRFQSMDLRNVDDVEILKVVFNKSAVTSVRCRLHMNGKKYDIWLYRTSRYGTTLAVGEDSEKDLMRYTEHIKASLLEAARTSSQHELVQRSKMNRTNNAGSLFGLVLCRTRHS